MRAKQSLPYLNTLTPHGKARTGCPWTPTLVFRASGLGLSGAQACKCSLDLLFWQLRAQELSSSSLPPSSCSQNRHLHWASPTAQEGAKPKPQPSRKYSPALGPAFTSGFSREKFDQALEEMQMLHSPWEKGVRVGHYPTLREEKLKCK